MPRATLRLTVAGVVQRHCRNADEAQADQLKKAVSWRTSSGSRMALGRSPYFVVAFRNTPHGDAHSSSNASICTGV